MKPKSEKLDETNPDGQQRAQAGVTADCPSCDGKGKITNAAGTGGLQCGRCGGSGEIDASELDDDGTRSRSGRAARRKQRHRSGPPLGREFRRFSTEQLEVRGADDESSDHIEISGMFLRYGAAYQVNDMFGSFTETMHPGVLSGVLSSTPDVRFLFNHEGMPYARTLNGTLTVEDTHAGGKMTALLDPDRSDARDLALAIQREDISQMSCGFIINDDKWSGEDDWGMANVRDVYGFEDLFDVSAVTYPASPTTSVELAYRALNAMDVESRARVRKLYTVSHELRAGKMLSADNTNMLQTALDALHEADQVDIPAMTDQLQTLGAAHARGKAGLSQVLDRASDGDAETEAEEGTSGSSDAVDPSPTGDGTTPAGRSEESEGEQRSEDAAPVVVELEAPTVDEDAERALEQRVAIQRDSLKLEAQRLRREGEAREASLTGEERAA